MAGVGTLGTHLITTLGTDLGAGTRGTTAGVGAETPSS